MTEGNDVARVIECLRAGALGTYLPNQALIRLSRDASFWLQANQPTLGRLGVFLHEYAHFLHNFSTITGIYEFIAQLRLLKLFMNTVDKTGRSHGSMVLDSESQRELKCVLEWRNHLTGCQRIPFSSGHTQDARITVRGITSQDRAIQLGSSKVPILRVQVRVAVDSRSWHSEEINLEPGSHMLMEGLAWELERMLFIGQGVSTDDLDQQFRLFPYRISRALFEQIANHLPSSEVMAKILLLSLQTSDPGNTFIENAKLFRKELDTGGRTTCSKDRARCDGQIQHHGRGHKNTHY